MKKLFTLLLMLAALLSSTQAWAENYNLYVAGVQVTDANKNNITGSGISGTVRYDSANKHLIINGGTTISGTRCAIQSSIDGLLIIFNEGPVTITTSSTDYTDAAVFLSGSTRMTIYTHTSSPEVTIKNNGAGRGIRTNSYLSIEGLRLTVTSAKELGIFSTSSSANLSISYSRVTATGGSGYAGIKGFGNISFYSSELDPAQQVQSGSIVKTDGSVAETARIYSSVTIGNLNVPVAERTLTTTNTGATSASGTVKYNTSTNTLTLTNVNIDGVGIVTRCPNLKVVFSGGGTLKSGSNIAMDLYGNTTLESDGTVSITSNGGSAIYVNSSNYNLTISMPEFLATSNTYDGVNGNGCTMTLKKYNDKSVYKFLGTRSNARVGNLVLDNMDIWSIKTFFKEGKLYYDGAEATASNGPSSGTWFKSKNQFTYYPLYVAGTQLNHRNTDGGFYSPYITSGTVSYNNGTKTLTLDKVTMDVTADGVNAIKTTSEAGDITIKTIGDNRLTAKTDAVDIFSNTTFTSDDNTGTRLFITSNNASGISTRGGINVTVSIPGGHLGAVGAQYGYYGSKDALTLKKAIGEGMGYSFKGTNGAIYNVKSLTLDNMDFYTSISGYDRGCYFDEADYRVEVNGGAIAKNISLLSVKEKLPIYVCGKQLNRVDDATYSIYVGSKYISSGAESVGYNPSTKTLTLNGAKIDINGLSNEGCVRADMGSGNTLTVDIKGTNEFKGSFAGLWFQSGNYIVQGTGTLKTNHSGSSYGMGVYQYYSNSKLTIQGDVTIEDVSNGGIGCNASSAANYSYLTIAGNATIKAKKVVGLANLTLNDGQTIVEPFKAAFNSSTHQVEANGSLAQDVVIQKVEKYDLAVCDVDVNSYNKDDILRDGGSFKYDPNMKRLTITDANIDDASVEEGIYNKGIEGLNIAINGDNQINVYEDIFKLARSTTFSGSGTVKSELTSSSGYGIYLAAANVIGNLNGPKFEFTGRRGVGDNGNSNTNLIIEKGCMVFNPNSSSASILNIQNLTLGSGMIIAKPQGGTFDSSKKGIVVNGSLYNGHAVISQKGDVNVDGTVAIADAVAVLNAMAGQEVAGDPDVNGDKEVSIADFVAVLNIMAGQ